MKLQKTYTKLINNLFGEHAKDEIEHGQLLYFYAMFLKCTKFEKQTILNCLEGLINLKCCIEEIAFAEDKTNEIFNPNNQINIEQYLRLINKYVLNFLIKNSQTE